LSPKNSRSSYKHCTPIIMEAKAYAPILVATAAMAPRTSLPCSRATAML
jgi:hypothetical protein